MTTSVETHRLSVLVVDDDALVADTITEILIREEYAASAAYDAESAMQVAFLAPPRLVISDVILPGMNGVDLGVMIRRAFPDCKVILLSGQPDAGDLVNDARSEGNHFVFLHKPMFPPVLLKHVEEILKQD